MVLDIEFSITKDMQRSITEQIRLAQSGMSNIDPVSTAAAAELSGKLIDDEHAMQVALGELLKHVMPPAVLYSVPSERGMGVRIKDLNVYPVGEAEVTSETLLDTNPRGRVLH